MRSFGPTKDKALPLRSTTIRHPERPTPQNAAADYSSIRLNTYHDTSDLRAALRKIEAAFAPVEQEGPTAPKPATAVSSATANLGTAGVRQTKPGDSTKSRPTIVVVKRSAAVPPTPLRKGLPAILQLAPQLLIHCCSFCDLRTLGVLCSVSVRMNVLVARQGDELWLAAAKRRRIPIAVAGSAREELRKVLVERARERHAEEAYYEAEIARMEERLLARTQDIYAQNIDVDRTLRMYGAASTPAPVNPEPFWLQQRRRPLPKADDREKSTDTTISASAQSTEMRAKLRTEIEALEEMKRICQCRLKLQEEVLLDHDAQLRKWQSVLLPCEGADFESPIHRTPNRSEKVSSHTEGDAATATTMAATEGAAQKLVSPAQMDEFERRIVRLVLNGSAPTSSAAIADASSGDSNLPVVLRRGAENFVDLELVLRIVGRSELAAASAPANQGAVLTGNTKGTATTGATVAATGCDAALRAAAKRWCAFQKFCPTNEEYENARLLLKARARRDLPVSGAKAHGEGASNADKPLRPPLTSRHMPALLRLSGFVRRVEAMSDSQVVREWM
ncbi:hypothetical protein JKF63_01731 [Porcisia hertigi]|uniref:Uncharacterized protein n=1 Tax=Porcisia hertigi TaxID=2761500 RepID=A0A836HLP8_9TRYP|nr:hypothetical protein JKF63_01731 [Porcisia hertigi]